MEGTQKIIESLKGFSQEYAIKALKDKAYRNLLSYEFTEDEINEALEILGGGSYDAR